LAESQWKDARRIFLKEKRENSLQVISSVNCVPIATLYAHFPFFSMKSELPLTFSSADCVVVPASFFALQV
jgi:hypothetical protein